MSKMLTNITYVNAFVVVVAILFAFAYVIALFYTHVFPVPIMFLSFSLPWSLVLYLCLFTRHSFHHCFFLVTAIALAFFLFPRSSSLSKH